MTSNEALAARFLHDLAAKNYSVHTARSYAYTLQDWLSFIAPDSVLDVVPEQVREYLHWLRSRRASAQAAFLKECPDHQVRTGARSCDRHSPTALARSFHRGTFTPRTRSHRVSDPSPTTPAGRLKGHICAPNGGDRKVVKELIM